jgi:adenylylsulfate kinase
VWFTGLSGSGKTTIANELAKRLRETGEKLVVLDGDIVRKTLSSDLGYSKEERDQHITRVAHACELISKNNVLNIGCVISPTKKIREYAREIIGKDKFVEVYVKCSIEVCEKRDVKGHYAKVRSGEIKEFVGISVPYEEPENPSIILNTEKENVNESVSKLIDFLNKI